MITLIKPDKVIEIDGNTYKLVAKSKDKVRIVDGGTKDPDKKYSWWDDHEYVRRSVANNFYKRMEPDDLLLMVNTLPQTTKELFCVAYETGGRANEVLSLKPEQFQVDKKQGVVVINRMMVEKLRNKGDRTFPIKLGSPYTTTVMELVNKTKKGEPLFEFGYDWMYNKIRNINKEENDTHGDWWCHRIRAEKASSLVIDYGFDVFSLMKFFGWKRMDIPAFYVRLSPQDLINKILKGEV